MDAIVLLMRALRAVVHEVRLLQNHTRLTEPPLREALFLHLAVAIAHQRNEQIQHENHHEEHERH